MPSTTLSTSASEHCSAYRFLAHIAGHDIDRALRAVKIAAPAGELRLVLITCPDLGLPIRGAALYVLSHLAPPAFFWSLFQQLAPEADAGAAR